eukprot:TRINITY_DN2216_c1_g1_i1.p1 TRINITY_DN2216_c1_g1~~TRINITY_DN2216_c1_g1_i1.p1  ORF type:complete len:924 (+),score=342.39 TRINITY_DN2216_c1_g1_i1:109-2880(+)
MAENDSAPALTRTLSKSQKKRLKKKEREKSRNASKGAGDDDASATPQTTPAESALTATPAEESLEQLPAAPEAQTEAAPAAPEAEAEREGAAEVDAAAVAQTEKHEQDEAAPAPEADAERKGAAEGDAAAVAQTEKHEQDEAAPAPEAAVEAEAAAPPAEAADAAGEPQAAPSPEAADEPADKADAPAPPAPQEAEDALEASMASTRNPPECLGGEEGGGGRYRQGTGSEAAGTEPATSVQKPLAAAAKDKEDAAVASSENDIVDALVIPNAKSEMVPATGSYQLESSGVDEKELIMDLEIPKTTSMYTCEKSKAESMCERPKRVEVTDRKFGNVLTFEGKPGGGLQYYVNDTQRPDIHKIDYEEGSFVLKFPELNKGCYLPSIVRTPKQYYAAMSELRRLCSVSRVRNSIPPDSQLPVLLPYTTPPPATPQKKEKEPERPKKDKPCPVVLLKHQNALRIMFVRDDGLSEASVAFLEYNYDPEAPPRAPAADKPAGAGGKPPAAPKDVFDSSHFANLEYTVSFYSSKWELRYRCTVQDLRRSSNEGQLGGFSEIANLCQSAGVWAFPAVGVPLPTHLDLDTHYGEVEVPPAPLKIALANNMTAMFYPRVRRSEKDVKTPKTPKKDKKDQSHGAMGETFSGLERAMTTAAEMAQGPYELVCYRTDASGATTDTPVKAVFYNTLRASLSVSSSDLEHSGLTLNLKLPTSLLKEDEMDRLLTLFKVTGVGYVTNADDASLTTQGDNSWTGVQQTETNNDLSGLVPSDGSAKDRPLLGASAAHNKTIVIKGSPTSSGESLSLLVVLWGFGVTPESRHLKLRPKDKVTANYVHKHLSQDTQWLEARDGAVDRGKFGTQAVYWLGMADTSHPSFCPQTIQPGQPIVQQGYRSGASTALHIVHTSAKDLLQFFRSKSGGQNGKKKDCCVQ